MRVILSRFYGVLRINMAVLQGKVCRKILDNVDVAQARGGGVGEEEKQEFH